MLVLALAAQACGSGDGATDATASDDPVPQESAADSEDSATESVADDEADDEDGAATEAATETETASADADGPQDFNPEAILVYGNNGMSSADPVRQNEGCEHVGLYTIFDTLFQRLPDGSFGPRLATGYELVDASTVRISLREGVLFQDGTDFNADAVAFHLDRALNGEESTIAGTLDFVQDVIVVDDLTVDIVIEPARVALLLASLAYRAGMIASPTAFAAAGDSEAFSANPVGAGPYAIEGEWFFHESLSVRAWDGYWDAEHRYLGGIDLLQISTDQRLAALQAGDIQMAFIEDESVAAAEAADGISVVSTSTGEVRGIVINESIPPLDDVRVRQALQYATDREGIAQAATGGVSQPAFQYFAPDSPAYDSALDEMYPYDPERARELLAEAGYPDGVDIQLHVPPTAPTYVTMGELWAGNIEESGFRVTINPVDRATIGANLFVGGPDNRGTFQAMTYGFQAPIDPEVSVRIALLDDGFQNAGGHMTDGLREATDAASLESDPEVRAELLQEVSAIALEDSAGVVTLWYQSGNAAHVDAVGGLTTGGTNCTISFDGLYISS